MTRYHPYRRYVWIGLAAWAMAVPWGWVSPRWPLAIVPALLLLAGASLLLFVGLRPVVEIGEQHLVIGNRAIPWAEIRRVDRIGWRSPLVVRLTLSDNGRVLVIYPGDLDSANSLLRHIRRSARAALIEGRPYSDFWGEALPAAPESPPPAAPRYRLLRPEDEAEVERLYQRLKTAGRIDSKSSTDET